MRTILDFDTLEQLQNAVICVVPIGQENHYDDLQAHLPFFRLPIVKVSARYRELIYQMDYDPDMIHEPFMIWMINGDWVCTMKKTSIRIMEEMEQHYIDQIIL